MPTEPPYAAPRGLKLLVARGALGREHTPPLTGNVEGLIEINTRARLRIDRNTLTPDWDGGRLDPEPILDALLPHRIRAAA